MIPKERKRMLHRKNLGLSILLIAVLLSTTVCEKNIFEASKDGNLRRVKSFIEKGANVNASNNDWQTALTTASSHGRIKVVKYLIENGADINTLGKEPCSYFGGTALMHASSYGHLKVVKYLVESGADINLQNPQGSTALMWASVGEDIYPRRTPYSEKENIEIIKYLIENGVDINNKNRVGDTALIWALSYGHLQIAKYLEEVIQH